MDDVTRPTLRESLNLARLALLVGLSVRLIVMFVSIGSNDTGNVNNFAILVDRLGFFETWRHTDTMNHPPIPVLYWSAIYRLTGDALYPFGILLKLPPLLTDAAAMVLVARIVASARGGRAGRVAAMLFAVNPVSILITAFHGNTDSVVAFFVLLTWYFADRGRWFGAALAMSAALNTKISPSFTLLVLLAGVPGLRELARVLAGLAIGAVPFALMRLFAGPLFVDHVLGYTPVGFSWLSTLAWDARGLPTIGPAMMWFAESHRATVRQASILIAVLCAIRLRRSGGRISPLTTGALTWCAFMFWNGGNFQYCVWPVPLLAAVRPRLAVAYGLAAGTYLFWAYVAVLEPTYPLESNFRIFDDPDWNHASPLVLAALAAAIVSLLRDPARPRVAD